MKRPIFRASALVIASMALTSCFKKEPKVEFSDSDINEWNGITLGKSTREDVLKKWPDCKAIRGDKNGCIVDFSSSDKIPLKKVSIGFFKDTVQVIQVMVKTNYMKEYAEAFFKKYGMPKKPSNRIKGAEECLMGGIASKLSESNVGYFYLSENYVLQVCDGSPRTLPSGKFDMGSHFSAFFVKKLTEKEQQELKAKKESEDREKREAVRKEAEAKKDSVKKNL